jgi:hypothetical protein
VEHKKREKQSRTDGKKEEFEFEWQLKMSFSSNMDTLQKVEFHITDLVFYDDADQATVADTTDCFKDYR